MVGLLLATAISAAAFTVFKLGDARKRVREWIHINNTSLGRLSDTFTVAWVTMQTLVLVVENHESVGGEDPPSLVRWGLTHQTLSDDLADHPFFSIHEHLTHIHTAQYLP